MCDDYAFELIGALAKQLLALNGGKAIPLQWKNYLLKSIRSKPGKAGRKRNYAKVACLVMRLFLHWEGVRLERTKQHNPGVLKDRIAAKCGASRKTVDRIERRLTEYWSGAARLDPLSPEGNAYIDGLSAAILESLRNKA